MFCSNCGNELKEGQRFCGVCGAPVSVKEEVAETPRVEQVATPVETPVATSAAVPVETSAANPVETAVPTPQASAPVEQAYVPQNTATRPAQQTEAVSWNEVAANINNVENNIGVTTTGPRMPWSTPKGLIAFVGKIIAFVLLIVPSVESPLMTFSFNAMSGSSGLGSLLPSGTEKVIGSLTVLKGPWNAFSFNGMIGKISSLVKLGGLGDNFEVLSDVKMFAFIASILWIALLVLVLFTIVRSFINNNKLQEAEKNFDFDLVIYLALAALTIVWIVFINMINGQVYDNASSEMLTMLELYPILSVTVWTYVLVVVSLLVAFWNQISKFIGLSK